MEVIERCKRPVRAGVECELLRQLGRFLDGNTRLKRGRIAPIAGIEPRRGADLRGSVSQRPPMGQGQLAEQSFGDQRCGSGGVNGDARNGLEAGKPGCKPAVGASKAALAEGLDEGEADKAAAKMMRDWGCHMGQPALQCSPGQTGLRARSHQRFARGVFIRLEGMEHG